MAIGIASACHVRSPKVELGSKRVVSATMQRDVCSRVRPSLAERLSVMELDVMCFLAAYPAIVDIGAACAVRGNVPAVLGFASRR